MSLLVKILNKIIIIYYSKEPVGGTRYVSRTV